MESHAEWFDEVAGALGWEVWCFDRPGWGRSPGTRGYLRCAGDALLQVEEVARHLRELHPQVHLCGLSWGGLLALYAGIRRGDLFDSLCLVAPGIFPRRTLSPVALLKVVAGRALGREWPVPLPLRPEDFTRRPDRREWIRRDPHRIREVGPGFCWATARMRRFVLRETRRAPLPRTMLFLGGADPLIDNRATRQLLAACRTQYYPRALHSLVLEEPRRLARDMALWLEGNH